MSFVVNVWNVKFLEQINTYTTTKWHFNKGSRTPWLEKSSSHHATRLETRQTFSQCVCWTEKQLR